MICHVARLDKEGRNVLVHCRLGVNRSVTVVAAYLIRCRGFTAEAALEFLKQRRPCAKPNDAYCAQLYDLDQDSCLCI